MNKSDLLMKAVINLVQERATRQAKLNAEMYRMVRGKYLSEGRTPPPPDPNVWQELLDQLREVASEELSE